MIQEEVVEPAKTELARSIVFASETDGSLRFLIYCCKVNEVKVKDPYPVSSTNECIDYFGEAGIFLTIDASSGYWQI